MSGTRKSLWLVSILLVAALVACSDDDTGTPGPDPSETEITADRCLVWLHGRSGTGAEPVEHPDHVELSPTGNDTADGGFQWLYDTDENFREATTRIEEWIDHVECTDVVVHGFSNGAAFASSLWCNGESFDGRLRGVVVDDPVTDEAVLDCAPPADVPAALYWTGALTEAQPGTPCADIGYTCSGDVVLGINNYAAELGVAVQPSPHSGHDAHREAPELLEWLLGSSM